jgi:hypothetical protein
MWSKATMWRALQNTWRCRGLPISGCKMAASPEAFLPLSGTKMGFVVVACPAVAGGKDQHCQVVIVKYGRQGSALSGCDREVRGPGHMVRLVAILGKAL